MKIVGGDQVQNFLNGSEFVYGSQLEEKINIFEEYMIIDLVLSFESSKGQVKLYLV